MKKLFKKLALAVVALLTFSVGSNYTVKEVRAADATVTYAFDTGNTVNSTGSIPEGSSAVYNTTYSQKHQLTAGNSMTLELSGYEGYTIKGITLSMKSNSKKGAGSFSAKAGNTVISSIADSNFNSSSWNGAWSTSFVDIKPNISNSNYVIASGEELVLTIAASTNSIYCQSMSLTYGKADDNTPVIPTLSKVENISYENSVITWDAVENASSYNVSLKNDSNEEVLSELNVTTNSISTGELEPSMYTFSINAVGDGVNYLSGESSTYSFIIKTYMEEIYKFTSIEGKIEDKVSYKAEKGNAANAPTAQYNNQIRVYQNGGLISLIAADGYFLSKVAIGSSTACPIAYTLDDSSDKSSTYSLTAGEVYIVNNLAVSSITFHNVGTTSSHRINVNFLGADYIEKPLDLPTLSISGESHTKVGETLTLTANTENIEESIVWTSSNNDVATVDANGVVTPKAMGEVTIKATAEGVESSHEIKVYPDNSREITIAEAIAICELTGTTNSPYEYSATGTIETIDYAYNSSNNNISVTITDGENSIYAFKMTGGSDLSEGDIITITGTLKKYNSTNEFDEGCTYVKHVDPNIETIRSSLNNVDSYMSLAYSYKETITKEKNVVDTLDRSTFGVTDTTYTDWTGKSSNSDAVYAGRSAGGYQSIQLRTSGSSEGIVSTTSGGKIKRITIEWNTNTSDGRTLDVYGKNSSYESANELYDKNTYGELLCSFTYNKSDSQTAFTFNFEKEFEYIGIRSNNGALYLSSISIEWETNVEREIKTMSDSQFLVRFGIDTSIKDIENIDSYGIRVSAAGKTVDYPAGSYSWGLEETTDPNYYYVVVDLGNIINKTDRLQTTFSVCAYAEYDGLKYTSEKVTEYSVVDMVKEYYTNGSEETKAKVEHLYNYLDEQGLIA